MSNRGTLLALVLFSALLHQPLLGLAEESEEDQEQPIEKVPPTPTSTPAPSGRSNPQDTILPETSVSSSRIRDERINKTQSITKITSEDLERRQVSTVFDAVRNTAGVSIDGGPRLNGMSFNIRGFESNDVAVSVDGVLKNYEKYRSKGTYIEPDLLKTIEIRRGPQINSNSGFLGGAVITVTKDAEDFLRPGQMAGARLKFGYGNNNDEYLRSYLAYARPHDKIDLIYNYTNRQSNNIMQGNGEELAYSNLNIVSELYKITLFPIDSLRISTSLAKLTQGATVQQYDTLSQLGSGFSTPYVLRAIDEETISQTWEFTPDTKWINLKASIGTGHTDQDETTPRGWQGNDTNPLPNNSYCDSNFILRNSITNNPIIPSNPNNTARDNARICRGDRLDAYQFHNTNFDLANTAQIYETDGFGLSLLTGIQYAKQKTETERSYDNPASIRWMTQDANPVASSIKVSTAFYIQPTIQIKRLTITPGYRKDYTSLEALDANREAMEKSNQRHKIHVNEEIYNLALAYDLIPKNLVIFANYGQGFRPISAGNAFLISGYVNGEPAGSSSQCPRDHSSCDNIYKTQRIESSEAGINYSTNQLFNQPIQLTSKATFFHSHTSDSVVGISSNAPIYGTQVRNGWEFENSLNYKAFYAQASYSRIAGKTLLESGQRIPIYTLPGNVFNLTLGFSITSTFDFNINYRRISDKRILSGSTNGINGSQGTQDGYELFNAGIRWSPSQHLTFRLVGENLGDKQYNLDGGFAGDLGLPGPGRNIKFYTELIY